MSISQTLKQAYPHKTELHCHTCGASDCASATPEQAVRLYAAAGYTSVVFTNHFLFGEMKNDKAVKEEIKKHVADFEKGKKEGERVGLNVIFATELRFVGDINDYLFYGPEPDFYMNIDFKKTRKLEDFSAAYRNDTNLLIQAHPFRTGITLAPLEYIDGIEAFNLNIRHNSRVGIASQYAEENGLLAICGTDFHHANDGQLCALCTKDELKTSVALVKALKGAEVAWKIGGATLVF